MRTKTAGNRAAIYTRISRDAEGLALGVERQRQDLEVLATERGLEVVARYEDNDVGASTRSRKPRPSYRQLIADAERGGFDLVLAYTSSRLTRRPRENEDLIELAERRGVRFVYRNSPSFDLNTADGRNVARILASNDAAESERIGERVQRRAKQRAEAGEWHGGRPPCGYRFVRDAADRVVGMEVDEPRAAVLREMAQRVLDGDSLYAMCRDLNRRGLRTPPNAKDPEGSMWRSQGLKRALTSPAVVGMREYDGETHKGTWAAILDVDTWQLVRDVLLDPERTDPTRSWVRDTSRKRALSGLLVCGSHHDDGKACGKALVSQPIKGVPSMICHRHSTGGCGHLRINYEPVERRVVRQLVERLNTDAVRAALADADTDNSDEEARLRHAIREDQRRLRKLEDDLVDEVLSREAFRRQQDRLNQRIETARRALGALAGRRRAASVATGADLEARLAEATVEQQRALLSEFIGRVVIKPHPVGVPTNVTKRKDETDEEFKARLADLRESTLKHRVQVEWKA